MTKDHLEEAKELEEKLRRVILENEFENKSLHEQLRKTNHLNLKFGEWSIDLENIISHQKNPTDIRGIGFESNSKAKGSKDQEVEDLREDILKVSSELILVKIPLEESLR